MSDLPLFELATRRAVVKRGLAAAGALVAGAWLAACGNDDKSAFASTTVDAGQPTTNGGAGSSADPTTAWGTATPTSATAAGDVKVSFTYTASDQSGRVRNPFIAVWVEDASSNLVGLLGLW
jgi:hypothetical protein